MTCLKIRTFRLTLCCLLVTSAVQAAKEIKPGWNLFTPAQDVELGQQAASEIEQQVSVVDDPELTAYVAGLGERLAKAAPGHQYPYSFKMVADPTINAFALPGGPIYVHTGLLTAADNEAQVMGVLAHEVAHVALRHGTNRVSKAYAWQIPLALAGGVLDQKGGLAGALAQLGIGFGLNSLFLKYSRSAEKDADILGARIMADIGHDPKEMAAFFAKLESEAGSSRIPQFFSDHPNPGNRVEYVSEEVRELPQREYTKGDQRQFDRMKARAANVKIPEKREGRATGGGQGQGTASAPSSEAAHAPFRTYRGDRYHISIPSTWEVYQHEEGSAATFAPEGGLFRGSNGAALAMGIMTGIFETGTSNLTRATDQLLTDLQGPNSELTPVRGQRLRKSISGQPAETMLLTGPSPYPNQSEMIWLVTAAQPEGVFYAIFVAPDSQYNDVRSRFEEIADSVSLAQ